MKIVIIAVLIVVVICQWFHIRWGKIETDWTIDEIKFYSRLQAERIEELEEERSELGKTLRRIVEHRHIVEDVTRINGWPIIMFWN